jgi:hypothetical protein
LYKSQTCVTPGGYTNNSLKSASRNSDTARQVVSFRFSSMCTYAVYINVVFETCPQTAVTRGIGGATSPQRTTNDAVPKICSVRRPLYCWHCLMLHLLAGRTRTYCPYHLHFTHKCLRICPLSLSEFIMSGNKMSPIILVALAAHHSPNLISRNGKSYVSLVLSADKFLIFLVLTQHFI